jgi:D-threo-aldose 1-dehydrogenase
MPSKPTVGQGHRQLPPLGLGTATLGGLFEPVGEAEAVEVVREALRQGMRLIDTAPLYGSGAAERRIGSALAGVPREQFLISTKVGRLLRQEGPPDPGAFVDGERVFASSDPLQSIFDYSAEGVRLSVLESLERLRLDYIDLALLHDPEHGLEQALTEGYAGLLGLQGDGLIRAVGAGVNDVTVGEQAIARIDLDYLLLAGRYTLLDQTGLSLLDSCAGRGIRVIIGGAFNSGVLAQSGAAGHFDYRDADDAVLRRVRAIQNICSDHDVPLATAAIHFPLGHPAVESVVLGCRTSAEVRQNAAARATTIPDSLWAALKDNGLLPERMPTPQTDQQSSTVGVER